MDAIAFNLMSNRASDFDDFDDTEEDYDNMEDYSSRNNNLLQAHNNRSLFDEFSSCGYVCLSLNVYFTFQ